MGSLFQRIYRQYPGCDVERKNDRAYKLVSGAYEKDSGTDTQNLKLVGAVVEVVDARIPISPKPRNQRAIKWQARDNRIE